MWKEGYARYVLPSGKYNLKVGYFPGAKSKKDIYPGEFETEWDFLKHVLLKCGVDESVILKETKRQKAEHTEMPLIPVKLPILWGLR